MPSRLCAPVGFNKPDIEVKNRHFNNNSSVMHGAVITNVLEVKHHLHTKICGSFLGCPKEVLHRIHSVFKNSYVST